jgi:hypothetical protein
MQTSDHLGEKPNNENGEIRINRDNCARHLVEKELEMVGKTMIDTLNDMEWFTNITMTKVQHDEFKTYAIALIKKIYKVNTKKANDIFDWFDFAYGLRVKD